MAAIIILQLIVVPFIVWQSKSTSDIHREIDNLGSQVDVLKARVSFRNSEFQSELHDHEQRLRRLEHQLAIQGSAYEFCTPFNPAQPYILNLALCNVYVIPTRSM